MKDEALRRLLQGLPVPPASSAARARAQHRALLAFEAGHLISVGSVGRTRHWKWVGASLLAGIVAIAFIYCRPQVVSQNVANDRQLLKQMELLFPGQINDVTEQNGKVDLSVAQSSLVGAQQPVVIVFRKNDQSVRVLSYSGHHVCVSLGSERRCFDILATATGSVILESGDKVWMTSSPVVVAGYSVQARTLEAPL